jgi:hypothetical protein
VNNDPMKQPDEKVRDLTSSAPGFVRKFIARRWAQHIPRRCTLSGAYGRHWLGEAANDDGSGTALVMELARILSSPDVQTERSVRFALWNNEETGLNGARAYVEQRKDLQGIESLRVREVSGAEMAGA